MKINQFGTLAIIGVAALAAACGGSPTKPTALNPLAGSGGSASSFTVSDPKLVGAVDQICTTSQSLVDENGNETGEAPAADTAPVMTCDVPASEPPADSAVISDSSSMESARFVNRFHR